MSRAVVLSNLMGREGAKGARPWGAPAQGTAHMLPVFTTISPAITLLCCPQDRAKSAKLRHSLVMHILGQEEKADFLQ